MSKSTRTFVTVGAAVAIVLAVVVVTRVLWWDTLPNPVATHFGFGGQPDGFMTQPTELWFALGLALGLPLLFCSMLRFGKHYGRPQRLLAGFAVGIDVFIASLTTWVLGLQVGLADATQARLEPVALLAPLGLGVAAAFLTYAVLPAADPAPVLEPQQPALKLSATDKVSWSSSESSKVLIAVAAVATAGGLVVAILTPGPVGWIVFATGAFLGLSMTRVSVRIDERGIAWWLGIGLIRGRIGLATLSRAIPVEVNPAEYGGWGYRFSSKGAAIVVRSGPGLTFERRNRMNLTITVPDATTGAAVANALRERTLAADAT